MQDRIHDDATPPQAAGRLPAAADPYKGATRFLGWTLWIMTVAVWLMLLQADYAFFRLVALSLIAGAIGALSMGRSPRPGRRACASGLAAFLATVALIAFAVHQSLENMRF